VKKCCSVIFSSLASFYDDVSYQAELARCSN